MKNKLDSLLFHTSICAGASQIDPDGRREIKDFLVAPSPKCSEMGVSMVKATIKAVFESDIQTVWGVVTDVEKYSEWRSDLSKCEIVDEKHFTEYTKDGYATYFTVTNTETFKCWEFDMKNSNMTGHWIGKFSAKGNTTEVEFMEEVNVKNIIMKLFVKGYLKRQQATFTADLEKCLG